MADFNWEVYANTPAWMDIGSNLFIFSGDQADLTVPITVTEWNLGMHLGSGEPGTDQCGTNHVPCITFVSSTEFKLNGGSTETISDGNLAATECTLRVKFTDSSSVTISNGRFFVFNGTDQTVEAEGVEAYAVEAQVGASSWTLVNDDSANTGGDNDGERLSLSNQGAGTEHYFYIAMSARPESVGAKPNFDVGLGLTYS